MFVLGYCAKEMMIGLDRDTLGLVISKLPFAGAYNLARGADFLRTRSQSMLLEKE